MCMLDDKPGHVGGGGEVELLALTFLVSHLKIERNTVQSPSLHPQHRYASRTCHTCVYLPRRRLMLHLLHLRACLTTPLHTTRTCTCPRTYPHPFLNSVGSVFVSSSSEAASYLCGSRRCVSTGSPTTCTQGRGGHQGVAQMALA